MIIDVCLNTVLKYIYRAVDGLFTNIDRMFPDMNITITRPCASNVVLLVIYFQNILFLNYFTIII